MLFRQLLDPDTSTYTYLLADETTREAVIIDPVRDQLERDVELIAELGLTLGGAFETHVHADHVTGGGALKERLGCRLFVGEHTGVLTADVQLKDGDTSHFGSHVLEVRSTPGHTNGCVTYVCHQEGLVFTGDALLIRGCGRTDFQHGDSSKLYKSVWERILSLPEDTRIYPGHDYKGRTVSTVSEEKQFNRRLGDSKTLDQFIETMDRLALAYPKRIDEAVPANMASGITKPEPTQPSADARDQWAPIERSPSDVPVVAPGWVASHLDTIRIIDVREHMEFCGPLGHIEGAELVPFSQLGEAIRTWNRNEAVLTVCAFGTRSGKAALLLGREGFVHVASLHGGMNRWNEGGYSCVDVMGDRPCEDASVWHGMGI